MRLPTANYIGIDIVPELIAYNNQTYANEHVDFRQIDIVVADLPDGDVCLVRQVLQHLSNAEIMNFLRRVNFQFFYVTEGQPTVRIGPCNPDKLAGADVRFDWRTGRGRGVELNSPPFNVTTKEVFRAYVPPNETIVTERVFLK